MKKILVSVVALGVLVYARCDRHAQDLIRAYPHHLKACRDNHILWKDGTTMVYDDGKPERKEKILKHADIEDMFTHSYTKESYTHPKYDPGRYRNERFFRHMYGDSASSVRRHLTTIDWFGRKVRVTTVNNVHRHLMAVEHELKGWLKRHPEYRKYLVPIGGTFKWRTIAGTHRLSVHSFGAAIDINVKYSAYWRWGKRPSREIPRIIITTFEKHGFIWGGKWRHFDTMHFEYRPELLNGSVSYVAPRTSRSSGRPRKRLEKKPAGAETKEKYQIYTVKDGDTLWRIANRYHLSVSALRKANSLRPDFANINPGDKLKIPKN